MPTEADTCRTFVVPALYAAGWAIRAVLDKAIAQVINLSDASADERTKRIARFLEERRKGRTISAIAQSWGLSRECVSRTVSRQAIRLVTDRVLVIGRRKLAPVESKIESQSASSKQIA